MSKNEGSSRIGSVRLRRRGENWQADFRFRGRRERRLIVAVYRKDAERQALDLHVALTTGKYQGVAPAPEDLTIADAFGRAIADCRGNARTRAHYAHEADMFRRWLAEARPNVRYWSAIQTETLRAYPAHCIKAGLAHDSIRLRLGIVKMTSRYWFENDPERYRDVARPVRLPARNEDPFERAEKERRKALSRDALATFLDFLATDRPHLRRIVHAASHVRLANHGGAGAPRV